MRLKIFVAENGPNTYYIYVAHCIAKSEGNKGTYDCPNEASPTGKCLLHSRKTEDLDNALILQFNKDINGILSLDTPEIVFQEIVFPRRYSPIFPAKISTPLIFRDCRFMGQNRLKGNSNLYSMYFDHCDYDGQISFANFIIDSEIKFTRTTFGYPAEFRDIHGQFRFDMAADSVNNLSFDNLVFNNGLSIRIEQFPGNMTIRNTEFNSDTLINVTNGPSTLEFATCKFWDRTDVICNFHNTEGARILINECGINNLFLKNIKYDDKHYKVINPRLMRTPHRIHKKFRTFYRLAIPDNEHGTPYLMRWVKRIFRPERDPEFEYFVDFVRMSKDHFGKYSEYLELYQYYYRLDQFFSRLRPSYTWQKRIVNNIYRWFSDYGYSIWRPIIFLFGVLILFNIIYWIQDGRAGRFETSSLLGAFFSSFAHHLEQISFFRTPDVWFQAGSWKRFLLLTESLLLIPPISFLIIGIRKTFKRG